MIVDGDNVVKATTLQQTAALSEAAVVQQPPQVMTASQQPQPLPQQKVEQPPQQQQIAAQKVKSQIKKNISFFICKFTFLSYQLIPIYIHICLFIFL